MFVSLSMIICSYNVQELTLHIAPLTVEEQVQRLTKEADEARDVLEKLRQSEQARELEKSKAIDAMKAVKSLKSSLSDIKIKAPPLQETLGKFKSQESLYKLRQKIPSMEGFSLDELNTIGDGEKLKQSLDMVKGNMKDLDIDEDKALVVASGVIGALVAAAIGLLSNTDDDSDNTQSEFNVNENTSSFSSSNGMSQQGFSQPSSIPNEQLNKNLDQSSPPQQSSFGGPSSVGSFSNPTGSSFGSPNSGFESGVSKQLGNPNGSSFGSPKSEFGSGVANQSGLGSPNGSTFPNQGSPPPTLKGTASKGAGSGFTMGGPKGNKAKGSSTPSFGSNGFGGESGGTPSFGGNKTGSSFGNGGGFGNASSKGFDQSKGGFGNSPTSPGFPMKGSNGPFTSGAKKSFEKSSFYKKGSGDGNAGSGLAGQKGREV